MWNKKIFLLLVPNKGTASMVWNGLFVPHPFPGTTLAAAAARSGKRRRLNAGATAMFIISCSQP